MPDLLDTQDSFIGAQEMLEQWRAEFMMMWQGIDPSEEIRDGLAALVEATPDEVLELARQQDPETFNKVMKYIEGDRNGN